LSPIHPHPALSLRGRGRAGTFFSFLDFTHPEGQQVINVFSAIHNPKLRWIRESGLSVDRISAIRTSGLKSDLLIIG